MSPAEQARVLLAMVLCGAALGAVYDALFLLRRTMLQGAAAGAALDLIFGVVCAGGVISAALILRVDAFRWYTLAGALLGMGLYMTCVGAALRRIMKVASRFREKSVQKEREKAK